MTNQRGGGILAAMKVNGREKSLMQRECVFVLCAVGLAIQGVAAGVNLVKNPSFEDWKDGAPLPDGWTSPNRQTLTNKVFRSTDVDGIWTRIETRDFIVGKGQIGCEPQVGDEIEFLGNTYEVLSPNGEPAWRWSDAFHTAYRIHAKHTGG